VRGNRTVRSVILVVSAITFAAGLKSPLESLFALESLDAGTTGFGLLQAVWGAGMLIGSLTVSRIDRRVGHGALLTWSLVVVGLAVVLASASPVLGPVAVLWVFAGIANSTGTVAYETILQERTEDSVRGRVMAVLEAGIQAGLLAGVGLAAAADTIFAGGDPARLGLGLSGVLFALAGVASWALVQRRRLPSWRVEALELVPLRGETALLRILATGPAAGAAPVLVVGDRRLEPLPGESGAVNGHMRLGYGVPHALLEHAMVLDTGAKRLPLPSPAG